MSIGFAIIVPEKVRLLFSLTDYSVETAQLFEAGFDVLITTWPILAFHLGKEMRTWDYVIRTDCPGNNVITWTHPGVKVKKNNNLNAYCTYGY